MKQSFRKSPEGEEAIVVTALPKPKHQRIPIRFKILLYLLGFTAMIVALLWLSQVVFLGEIYQSIKQAEIRSCAKELSILASTDPAKLSDRAEGIVQDKQIAVVVYDRTKEKPLCSKQPSEGSVLQKILYQRNLYGIDYFSVTNAEVFCSAAVKAGGGVYHRVTGSEKTSGHPFPKEELILKEGIDLSSAENATTIIYTLVSEDAGGASIAVLLSAIVSPVSATVQTLRILLTAISVLLVLLAVILSFYISARISRPITRLTAEAGILATGNYHLRFDSGGYREAEELGSALRYAAEELSKVDSLRQELIANVSHDLRTPLTMISGYAEVMRDIPGENTPENLQIVIDESERLRDLVQDLLDLSKLQSGAIAPDLREFDLTGAIESELGRYRKLRDREGYQINFRYRDHVTVCADCSMIKQVVYNLINNAVNYTGPDKTVGVEQTLSEDLTTVRISVIDSGDGIPPEKLARIFERYYRENDHRRATVGSGLGLSIVKRLVEIHGGRYGVTSRVGFGSCFWFELPCLRITPPEGESSNYKKDGFSL